MSVTPFWKLSSSKKLVALVIAILGIAAVTFLIYFGDVFLALPGFNDLLWTDSYSWGVQLAGIVCLGYFIGFMVRHAQDNWSKTTQIIVLVIVILAFIGYGVYRFVFNAFIVMPAP